MRLWKRRNVLLFVVLCHSIPWTMSKSWWAEWRRLPLHLHKVLDLNNRHPRGEWKTLSFRAGASDDEEQEQLDASRTYDISSRERKVNELEKNKGSNDGSCTFRRRPKPRKVRHSYELIGDLRRRSGVSGNDESLELRRLISTRVKEYLEDLFDAVDADEEKLPHPRKLLHFLAPKIPAIKQSPDVNLRICSAQSDIDSGVAACVIGTLAQVCEIYDKEVMKREVSTGGKPPSVAPDITTDRRFEQLVECVLSGINVKKRKRESLKRQLDKSDGETPDIEEILDEEDAQEDEGLNIRDSCRAAWGIAILGAFHLGALGNEKVLDLLEALSLRIRELLLARLQLLRTDDLQSESVEPFQSTDERLHELAEELAEDAVSAMWTFACVKACTGIRTAPLFEACCSILCQDPVDMRRRAQEEEHRLVSPNIDANAVVDRLARSEMDVSMAESATNAANITDEDIRIEKDSLLDWLSPTEVSDVLWALALHGSKDGTLSRDEITLSETAATLREICFDRLLEWLNEDLELLNHREAKGDKSSAFIPSDTRGHNDTMTVEVVDAATLLKAQDAVESGVFDESIENMPTENITINTGQQPATEDTFAQEVQVVDAATLLASVKGDGPVEVETEVIVTPTALVDGVEGKEITRETVATNNTEAIAGSDLHQIASDVCGDEFEAISESIPIFSPRDLSSIAWAVTELRDPLQYLIVELVIRIFAKLGPSSTDTLKAGDLSNLAWAISRHEIRSAVEGKHQPNLQSVSILRWTAHSAVQRIRDTSRKLPASSFNILRTFQPPELGRLLWAMARTILTSSSLSPDVKRDRFLHELVVSSLLAAGSNLSVFATEDLARISWAFLELCDSTEAITDLAVVGALGGVLVTIEASLHRWERGHSPASMADTGNADAGNDASLFSSFFGKSRSNLKLLEELIGDQDDEDEIELAPILDKPQLPKLRDLTMDPSTLCKVACGFSRLSAKHPCFKGSWTLTRVAVRLLSSRNARLMKECSIHDIVRICEAAVLSEVTGHGREMVIGLFVRKFLQVLNYALDPSGTSKSDSTIELSRASPSEIATLFWALGELGVRHSLSDDNRSSAYRRMRLVCEKPPLTHEQVRSLSVSFVIKLLRGLVGMKFVSSDRRFLLLVLREVRKKANELTSGSDLCDLAESLAVLKEAVSPRDLHRETEDLSNKQESKSSMKDFNFTEPESEKQSDIANREDASPTSESLPRIDIASIRDELSRTCDQILQDAATASKTISMNLSSKEIRRLLMVYSLLPFQADDLVDSLSEEVVKRQQQLRSGSVSTKVGNLLRDAADRSTLLNRTLFGDSHEDSRMSAIKNGIKSFFKSSEDNDGKIDDDQQSNLSEELSSKIEESTNSIVRAAHRFRDIHSASQISPDGLLDALEAGTAFELGRCQELIENYRRVEFSTGMRRSRYDQEHRKNIAKRVLSRLLP